MRTLPTATLILPAIILSAATGCVSAQNFPVKPVRFVTSQPGGGADTAARIIATGISPLLGQPVVVDNRATGVIPGEVVSKSAPTIYPCANVWKRRLTFTSSPFRTKCECLPGSYALPGR